MFFKNIPKYPLIRVNRNSIPEKLLSKSLYIINSSYHLQVRNFSSNKQNLYNRNFNLLQKALKDINITQFFPLKDVVSLYSSEHDEELQNLMESELLSLYYNIYPQILKHSDLKFNKLKFKLKEAQESLFSGSIHKMSDCDTVILQILPGVGGEESACFASELFSMYENICKDRNFEFIKHSKNSSEITGGTDFFKYEFGVHRVQRIPFNSKRIQTSSAVVTVIPHFNIQNTKLKPSDLIIETMRSSGPGGQSVNKSETAVKITHIPTGISVSIRDTSSQIDNKSIAMELILKKIKEKQEKELEIIKSEVKSSQFKTGDRSEKIRTFNFIHDTIIDHRCKVTLNGVDSFLDSGTGIEKIHQTLTKIEESIIVNFMIENLENIIEFYRINYKV